MDWKWGWGGGGEICRARRGRVRLENINGMAGSGVGLKTSTFLLVPSVYWKKKQHGGTTVDAAEQEAAQGIP